MIDRVIEGSRARMRTAREELEALAEWQGIGVTERSDLPEGVQGICCADGQRNIIVLDATVRPEEQSDTLAHELSHWLLAPRHCRRGGLDDPENEREAAIIASALLQVLEPSATIGDSHG
jgi:Zn-dependent peptidase ImmA (M78 family)